MFRILAIAFIAMGFFSCGRSFETQSKFEAIGDAIDFHIKAGTGGNSWNKKEDLITLKIGQTLHVINDDSVVHRLHTYGAPCEHGPEISKNGGTWNCVISVTYDREADGVIYDHEYGPTATLWIKAVP